MSLVQILIRLLKEYQIENGKNSAWKLSCKTMTSEEREVGWVGGGGADLKYLHYYEKFA